MDSSLKEASEAFKRSLAFLPAKPTRDKTEDSPTDNAPREVLPLPRSYAVSLALSKINSVKEQAEAFTSLLAFLLAILVFFSSSALLLFSSPRSGSWGSWGLARGDPGSGPRGVPWRAQGVLCECFVIAL